MIEVLQLEGAEVTYFDPWVKSFKDGKPAMDSIPALTAEALKSADLAMVAAAHTNVDYDFVQQNAVAVFDTKNAMKNVQNRENIELLYALEVI